MDAQGDVGLPQPGHIVPSVDAALAEPLIADPDTREAVIRLDDLTGLDFLARAPSGHELILDTDPGSGQPWGAARRGMTGRPSAGTGRRGGRANEP